MFRRDEWAKLFPASIMSYLVAVCDAFTPQAGEQGEFFRFPDPARLPLVVGARMSLSFPGLISAVPLWCYDDTLKDPRKKPLKRCLFSDGGLSSDFPIHFFDRLLPNRPTFAISLDDFDPDRNDDSIDGEHRPLVWLREEEQGQRQCIAGRAVSRSRRVPVADRVLRQELAGQSAKRASGLPGAYRACRAQAGRGRHQFDDARRDGEEAERLRNDGRPTIVHTIRYGRARWRRFLVAMARMEEMGDRPAV